MAPARRASARTSPTPRRTRRHCSAPARARRLAAVDAGVVRRAPAHPGPVPAADRAAGVSAVSQLGVRLRRARPRAAPGRHDPARGARRECEPLSFVASQRLGEPPSLDPLLRRLEIAPGLRFKLDPTPSWDDELIASLVSLGAVESVDLKGHYEGTIVDNPADPDLFRRVVEAFPEPGSRIQSSPRRPNRSCERTARGSPGTLRSTPSRTSKRCPGRRGRSTSSLRGSAAWSRCSTSTTTARPTRSAATAAGRSG